MKTDKGTKYTRVNGDKKVVTVVNSCDTHVGLKDVNGCHFVAKKDFHTGNFVRVER